MGSHGGQSSADTYTSGSLGAPQAPCHLGIRQLLPHPQRHGLGLPGRQFLQCRMHLLTNGLEVDLSLDSGQGHVVDRQVRYSQPPPSPGRYLLSAVPAAQLPTCDREQPWLGGPPRSGDTPSGDTRTPTTAGRTGRTTPRRLQGFPRSRAAAPRQSVPWPTSKRVSHQGYAAGTATCYRTADGPFTSDQRPTPGPDPRPTAPRR